MTEAKIERRTCKRFRIPGATACYRKSSLFSNKKGFDEEFCPVIDLSRGGLRFLCQKPLKVRQKLSVDITIPGDRAPLIILGIVRWIGFNPGKSYKFQAGLQLNAYGDKKSYNSSETLARLTAMEEKHQVRKAANSTEPKP
jgi:hypothetical protein